MGRDMYIYIYTLYMCVYILVYGIEFEQPLTFAIIFKFVFVVTSFVSLYYHRECLFTNKQKKIIKKYI